MGAIKKEGISRLRPRMHLSVSGVMTKRPELPRYSYPYRNSAFTARMYKSSLVQ